MVNNNIWNCDKRYFNEISGKFDFIDYNLKWILVHTVKVKLNWINIYMNFSISKVIDQSINQNGSDESATVEKSIVYVPNNVQETIMLLKINSNNGS